MSNEVMGERKQISTQKLTLDNTQSRSSGWSSDDDDRRLVESIKNTGVMTALLVRPVSDASFEPSDDDVEYTIIAGSRRFHAAVEAGKVEVPCKIINADDIEAAILSFKENEERKDLTRVERAESLKLQFELFKPEVPPEGDPWVCPNCADEFTTSRGLHQHIKKSNGHNAEPFETRQKAATLQQAYGKLADEHFSSYRRGDAVRKIKSLVALASLPTSVRALFIHSDERSERQKQVFADLSISSDCTIALKHAPTVREFYDDLHHIQLEEVNPAGAVLRAVSEFDSQSATELGATLRKFKENFTEPEQTADDESSEADEDEEQEQNPDEASEEDTSAEDGAEENPETTDDQLSEQSFNEALEEHQEQLESDNESESHDSSTKRRVSATVRFTDDRHKRLHEKAKQTLSTTSDTEVVRRAHQAFLEQLAEKHDWDVTDDSDDN